MNSEVVAMYSGYLLQFHLIPAYPYNIVRFTEYGPESVRREFVVGAIELNVPAYIAVESDGSLLFDLDDISEYHIIDNKFIVG